jgi:hypothetical protein
MAAGKAWSDAANEGDSLREGGFVDDNFVVGKGTRGFDARLFGDGDEIEEFVGWGTAERGFVFKDEQGSWVHAASGAGGGLVKLEGVFQGGEEEFEIVVIESSLLGEERVHEALDFVEAVGDRKFAAHGALFLDIFLIGYRGAGNGVFAGNNRIDGTGEGDLHGATDLTAIYLGGHDGAEGADVVVGLAHPRRCFVFDFGFHGFGRCFANGFVSSFVLEVVDGTFGEIDPLAVLVFAGQCDEVADLAFEADVGDEALAGFNVDAWEIAGIGVAVGVCVLGVEEEEEVVTVVHEGWVVLVVDLRLVVFCFNLVLCVI